LSAPYVGQGSAAVVAGGCGAGVVVVARISGGGAIVVVPGRGRVLPHETSAAAAAISPTAAVLLDIAALPAEMAPEVGEES
jgi:hypothetical protein